MFTNLSLTVSLLSLLSLLSSKVSLKRASNKAARIRSIQKASRQINRVTRLKSRKPASLSFEVKLAARQKRSAKALRKASRVAAAVAPVKVLKRQALRIPYNPIALDWAQRPLLRKRSSVSKPKLQVKEIAVKALERPSYLRKTLKLLKPSSIKTTAATENVVKVVPDNKAKTSKAVKAKSDKEKSKISERQLRVERGRLADLKAPVARYLPTIQQRQSRMYANEHYDMAAYEAQMMAFQSRQNFPTPAVEVGSVEQTGKTQLTGTSTNTPMESTTMEQAILTPAEYLEQEARNAIFAGCKNFATAFERPLAPYCDKQYYMKTITHMVMAMRGAYGNGYGVPLQINAILKDGGILLEAFVPMISGGRELQRLLAQRSGTNIVTRMRASHDKAPNTKESIVWDIIPSSVPNYKYEEVLAAIVKKNRARQGEPIRFEGLERNEAKSYVKLVKQAMSLQYWDGNVIVPQRLYEALGYFLQEKGYQPLCTFVPVNEAWLMPLSGLEYDSVKAAFELLGQEVVRYLGKNAKPGVAPFVFVETDRGFELTVSGGNKFIVTAPVGNYPAQAYMQPMDSLAMYHMRPFVAGADGVKGKLSVEHCVKLSSLDALWYAFEVYGFANINREHNSNPKLADAKGGYFSRFVRNNMPVQQVSCERDMSAASGRALLEANKYVAVKVNMPMPIELMRRTAQHPTSWLSLQGSHRDREFYNVTAYYKQLAKDGALHTCNALSMTETAARHFGLVTNPNGAVKDFIEESIVAVNSWSKQSVVMMLADQWQSAGFAKKFGSFDRNDERTIVEAIFTLPEVAMACLQAGVLMHEAYGTKNERFWDVVLVELRAPLSSKVEKFVKRVVMGYAHALETNCEVEAGWRTDVNNVNKVTNVKSLVLPNLLLSPGMGLMNIDTVKAVYSKKSQAAKVVGNDSIESFWLEVDEKYSCQPLVTRNYDVEKVIGYQFNSGTIVKQGDVLGKLMTADKAGSITCYGTLQIDEGDDSSKYYLDSIKVTEEVDPGAERRFYVHYVLRCQVTNTLKLRSAVVLKLNVLAVKMWKFLDYENLNNGRFKNVDQVVPGDSFKAKDNFVAPVKFAGHQCANYGSTVPAMRDLLVKTNRKVAAFKGIELPTYDEWLYVDAEACAAGLYRELLEDFDVRFGTYAWFKEATPEADMPRIKAAHTRNRAVASLYVAEDRTAVLKGAPWRFVSADELSVMEDGKLPTELIDAVLGLEREGTYTDKHWAAGKAFAVTDAVGEIDEKDTVYIYWQTEDGEHHMLTRSYGYGSKDGLDLLYPVEVEAGTIPEAVSSTSMLPSETVWWSLVGYKEPAKEQMKQVRKNVAFDGILRRMLSADSIQFGAIPAEAVDGTNLSAIVEVLVGTEMEALLERHQADELVSDDEFLRTLAKVFGHRTLTMFIGNTDPTRGNYLNIHLQTLYDWNKGSLKVEGDSAVKALTSWLKLVLFYQMAPLKDQMIRMAGSVSNMLWAYYNGRNHLRSLLRGSKTGYMKAAACILVPDGELWLTEKTAGRLAKAVGKPAQHITHVVFRRMPMFAGCVCKLRILTNADVSYYRKKYGVLFCYGLAYMGSISMYVNFGDLDGDAISIADCSKQVAAKNLKVSTFDSVAKMLHEVTGVNVFDWKYWLGNAPDQYVADHFQIGNWKEFKAKSGFNWNKNVMGLNKLIQMQLAAGSVQSITVGYTYRVAILTMLLAEMMPTVVEVTTELTGEAPAWTKAFNWMLQEESASLGCARILQIYEIALGGYSSAMAKVTLGYLNRALQGDTDLDVNLPEDILKAIGKEKTKFDTILPSLGKVRQFTHVPDSDVRSALAELGFMAGDFEKFRDAFLWAGCCTAYSKDTRGNFDMLPIELRFVFSICQMLLDVSQAKLEEFVPFIDADAILGFRPHAKFVSLRAELEKMAESEDELERSRAVNVDMLLDALLQDTIAGQMFKTILDNEEAVQAENFVCTLG